MRERGADERELLQLAKDAHSAGGDGLRIGAPSWRDEPIALGPLDELLTRHALGFRGAEAAQPGISLLTTSSLLLLLKPANHPVALQIHALTFILSFGRKALTLLLSHAQLHFEAR